MTNIMKIGTLFLLLLWASVSAGAEPAGEKALVPPKNVALELVRAAQQNNLDRVIDTADLPEIYKGPHGREPRDLVAFLRAIDLKKVKITGGETVASPPAERASVILETSKGRMRIDFRLRTTALVLGDEEYSHHEVPVPPHYEIVEIHQHP